MKSTLFSLEHYKGPATRHTCPSCQHHREFTRYINTETGEYLAEDVGKCNRELRCGYHYKPHQYFADNPQQRAVAKYAPSYTKAPAPPRPIAYLPHELVDRSHSHFEANNLWQFFARTIGDAATNKLFQQYKVGSSKHWQGATAFWQVDAANRVRQCKVMLYDASTGKRVKQPKDYVYFAGKALLGNYDANLMQCLFGEHLLPLMPAATVAIVESEKTALFCAHKYPSLVWLATGGKQGCRWTEKAVFEPLKGRSVVLFPDLRATEDWQKKAQQVAAKVQCKIVVSAELENQASEAEKAMGLDLMDYLLVTESNTEKSTTQPPHQQTAVSHVGYTEPLPSTPPPKPKAQPVQNSRVYSNHWELEPIKERLANVVLPANPVLLMQGVTITDAAKFVANSLARLEANNGNPTYLPEWQRLQLFAALCEA